MECDGTASPAILSMMLMSPGEPLVQRYAARTQPATGQLRIRGQACGACGTDLRVVDGDRPFRGATAPGYEVVGVIEAVGPDVTGFRTGDRVGVPCPARSRCWRQSGRIVCGGTHMSEIRAVPYALLWHDRESVSVAGLTRWDAEEFFGFVRRCPSRTVVRTYPLIDATRALDDLRRGLLQGSTVFEPHAC